ncbi:unnamed protein product, partial [Mesorhabditis spiculigera]
MLLLQLAFSCKGIVPTSRNTGESTATTQTGVTNATTPPSCTSCTMDGGSFWSTTITTCEAVKQVVAEAECASVLGRRITWMQAQGDCYQLEPICPDGSSVLVQAASGPIVLPMDGYDAGDYEFVCDEGTYMFRYTAAGIYSPLQSIMCFETE